MTNIPAIAELLYIVSNFEKGRVKSCGVWKRKYVKSLKCSLEIMTLLTNLISSNKEISQDEISCLQRFICENNGIIFSCKGNIDALSDDNNDSKFSPHNFEDVINLMNDIILEIKTLLCAKPKNYKTKISYLLRAFHNLPRVFLDSSGVKVFELDAHSISGQEAIQCAISYLSLKEK